MSSILEISLNINGRIFPKLSNNPKAGGKNCPYQRLDKQIGSSHKEVLLQVKRSRQLIPRDNGDKPPTSLLFGGSSWVCSFGMQNLQLCHVTPNMWDLVLTRVNKPPALRSPLSSPLDPQNLKNITLNEDSIPRYILYFPLCDVQKI